ncbi:hypothetical protein [Chlamydia sp. 17-3921]|uniref:hypothetical protein n=1 Tax=Chlamydia sp. 17-3921 TaxID=2675798 RepID=UPI0019188114|nr:hypothetical protein [Chlamydia sp. 17-3921]
MISITQRLRPYTREPGKFIPIPGSTLYAQIFPGLWRLFSQSHELIAEESLAIPGPSKRFVVFQDLHRGGLAIHSEYYKYYLLPSGACEKSTQGLPSASSARPLLFLGVHKHADWQKIRSRQDLKEILPFWFRLGAMVPNSCQDEEVLNLGTGKLLAAAQEKILLRDKVTICSTLLSLAMAGFSDCFLPRLYDEDYQGILPKNLEKEKSVPFILLRKSFPILQEIFVRSQDSILEILPSLPPEFPCGRLIGVSLPHIGTLSLVWTKKTIRQLALTATHTTTILLDCGSSVSRCRQRQWIGKRQPGKQTLSLGESVEIKAGTTYLWDCFCK